MFRKALALALCLALAPWIEGVHAFEAVADSLAQEPEGELQYITVTHYPHIDGLVLGIIGAAACVKFYGDWQDRSDALDVFEDSGLDKLLPEKYEEMESKERTAEFLTLGTGLLSLLFLAIALTPEERKVPITRDAFFRPMSERFGLELAYEW
jgi:hypothetical protein